MHCVIGWSERKVLWLFVGGAQPVWNVDVVENGDRGFLTGRRQLLISIVFLEFDDATVAILSEHERHPTAVQSIILLGAYLEVVFVDGSNLVAWGSRQLLLSFRLSRTAILPRLVQFHRLKSI